MQCLWPWNSGSRRGDNHRQCRAYPSPGKPIHSAGSDSVPASPAPKAGFNALLGRVARILQTKPVGTNTVSDIPLNCPNASDSKPSPNPRRVGFVTVGPPVSRQRNLNASSERDQFNETIPLSVDKEPYFAALVASSCTNIAIVIASFAGRKTAGPSMDTRDTSYAPSSVVNKSRKSAPSPCVAVIKSSVADKATSRYHP